ncbi:MAG: ATP-binding cassette domain-containing protein, partial [Kurthia sp.]|nr:ATP-binding cassette domain-containing protein [Kurthia sp.]
VQGLQTLKLFGQGKQQREELAENNRAFQTSTMSILKVAFASTFFIELVVTLGIGLVAIEIAYQMITFETMTFAPAFFILAIAPEFYNAIKDLGSAFHSGRGSMAAAEILEEELERPIEPVKWGTQSLEQQPSIAIEQGAFQYGDAFKLEQLNVKVPPNSRTAIVGPTGQGKTTLLNILAGVYEVTEGYVKIDGKLRQEVSKDAWFEQIAYISQHPYLFTGTIAENIQMKKGACDEVAIQRAIEQAQLGDWIATLPNGMHTAVGEAGRGMSGGEKQRLAIARAFYKQCTIVFFDEPTMGLDVQTEQLLQRVMDELAQTRTVITVAHRLHTIQQADQILLVHNGTIEQTGTHQELLQKSAIYREMVGGERHEGTC